MERLWLPYPDTHPDNLLAGTDAISWKVVSQRGFKGRYGNIQPGFNRQFPALQTNDELIWLDRPTGNQALTVSVYDQDDQLVKEVTLRTAEDEIFVPAGHKVGLSTPEGQGDVDFGCEYPGVAPDV